jgi:hypothetical protein
MKSLLHAPISSIFTHRRVLRDAPVARRRLASNVAITCLLGMSLSFAGQVATAASPSISAKAASTQTSHAKQAKHAKKHVKHVKKVKHAKRPKHAIHARHSSHLSTHARVVALTANVDPNPDFLGSCSATSQSYFCLGQEVEAIDNARAQEGLGPITFRLAAFRKLSTAQQLFTLTNLERTARNLPPVVALTAQLDAVAARGAAQSIDPSLSGWNLSGGKQAVAWNSNWAGGLSSLQANYYWMYADGPGLNIDCAKASDAGCWGHRNNILTAVTTTCGTPSVLPQLVMGAANTAGSQYGPSDAEILVQECGGLPSDTLFTWTAAERLLGISPT